MKKKKVIQKKGGFKYYRTKEQILDYMKISAEDKLRWLEEMWTAQVGFSFLGLEDGQRIELGNTIAQVLHTPGHTPESICLVVSDLRRGPEPWFICTGDTLFVGATGRPDLPGQERENAAQLYDSLQQKLLTLPDSLEVYPAHYAGSACGAGMSGKPMTTLGFEKRFNPLLSLSKEEFVQQVSANIPGKPAEMETILRFNQGRDT